MARLHPSSARRSAADPLAISNVHQAHRLSQQLQEKRNQSIAKLKASAKRASQAKNQQQSPSNRDLPPLQASVTPIQGIDYTQFLDKVDQDNYDDDDSTDSSMAKLKKGEMIVKERDFQVMEANLAKSEEELTQVRRKLEAVLEQKKELMKQIASLKQEVASVKAGVGAKKALKMEQVEDICTFITQYIKDVVYRNTKFATKEQEKKNLVRKIYDALKGRVKDLSFDEFRRIYEPFILSDLSLRRQCSQSRMQHVSYEWWLSHGETLPTVEDMLCVWHVPDEVQEPMAPPNNAKKEDMKKYEADKKAYDDYCFKKELKTWYVDCYLAAAAGTEFWGPTVRPDKLPTDTYQDQNGKEKVFVTKALEASGLVQFENSRKRWLAVFEWKKANPGRGKKPPVWSKKKNQEILIYKCKWSDFSHGRGSGWDPQAYKVYKQRLDAITEFRKEEIEAGNPLLEEGRDLIREVHKIPQGETEPPQKKRKVEVALADDDDATVGLDEDCIELEEE